MNFGGGGGLAEGRWSQSRADNINFGMNWTRNATTLVNRFLP